MKAGEPRAAGQGNKAFCLCGSKEMAGGLAIALGMCKSPKERMKKDWWADGSFGVK